MVEFLPYFNEQQIPHKQNKILTYNENQNKKNVLLNWIKLQANELQVEMKIVTVSNHKPISQNRFHTSEHEF